jgi:AraC-like DNA-binding protein
MQRQDVLIPTVSGFKRFFSPKPTGSRELHVRGIGIRELMPPCMIERPRGTGDYLFMLFHDPAVIDTKPAGAEAGGPDMMMVWPPGKGQYYGNRARRFSHTWIHCEGDRVRRMLRASGVPVLRPFRMPNSSMFQQCLLNIHGELVSYASPDPVIIGNLLENCLRELARTMTGSVAAAPIPGNLLAVHRLISSAPAQDITLAEMARMAGMSASYFCSRFKAIFGLAPGECLIQHRMHHAVHLLNNRNLTISQIAAQVGYDDLFHFSKMFKKQFGLSPRAMRQRDAH